MLYTNSVISRLAVRYLELGRNIIVKIANRLNIIPNNGNDLSNLEYVGEVIFILSETYRYSELDELVKKEYEKKIKQKKYYIKRKKRI